MAYYQGPNGFNFSAEEIYEKILSKSGVIHLQFPELRKEDFAPEEEKEVIVGGLDATGNIIVQAPVRTCPHPCRPMYKQSSPSTSS